MLFSYVVTPHSWMPMATAVAEESLWMRTEWQDIYIQD